MSDYTAAELRNKVTHWQTIATFARRRFAASGTKEDADSITYAEAQRDRFLDQILALSGNAGVIPNCHSPGCTVNGHIQPMSTFGTQVWWCPECDFRECIGCRRRVCSLTAIECPTCGYIVAAPRSADDELD